MKLVKVDAFDAEPSQRVFALTPNRVGRKHALDVVLVLAVPHQPTFGEDVRAVAPLATAQESFDDFLGVSVPIYRRSVDPVDAGIDSFAHRRQRGLVVLRPPFAATGRPRAKAEARDVHVGGAELALREC